MATHRDRWWRFTDRFEIRITDPNKRSLIAYFDNRDNNPAPVYLDADELVMLGTWLLEVGQERKKEHHVPE